MYQAALLLLSIVASHSCTVDSLLGMAQHLTCLKASANTRFTNLSKNHAFIISTHMKKLFTFVFSSVLIGVFVVKF